MFANILVAADGSVCGLHAAGAAAELAKTFGARLIVVNVYQPPMIMTPYEQPINYDMEQEAIDRLQNEVIAETGCVIRAKNVVFDVRKEIGQPAARIVEVAENEGCDLIVVGSRGLSGIKSFFLGSVSDGVSHEAKCPVLIVK